MEDKKDFYFTNSRFKFIALILFLMWIIFIIFLFIKTEEISKNPCSICAKRLGDDVTCYAGNFEIYKKIYYYNGSQELIKPGLIPGFKP